MKKIGLASDHAGFKMKDEIIVFLNANGYETVDFGTYSEETTDYPDYAHPLSFAIENNEVQVGISFCGSGNGINMAANKHKGIRSAICWNREISKLARMHNDANICAIPARYVSVHDAKEIIFDFLNTAFDGGRHLKRINKIPIPKGIEK
jgi:ribose 5-phosphate isomerase B